MFILYIKSKEAFKCWKLYNDHCNRMTILFVELFFFVFFLSRYLYMLWDKFFFLYYWKKLIFLSKVLQFDNEHIIIYIRILDVIGRVIKLKVKLYSYAFVIVYNLSIELERR